MSDTKFNERAWLAWLVKVRIIIITFLLVVELLIVYLTPTNVPVRLFIGIIWSGTRFLFSLLFCIHCHRNTGSRRLRRFLPT